jgi:acyl dehydratase
MPIDPEKARGAALPEGKGSWNRDQVILYHLGLGAGARATDAKELEYVYEKNLKVLPSFGVIPVFATMGGMGAVPGMQINFAMVLHGEQDLEIHQPIPVEAKIRTQGRVAGLYDKGKAALIVLEVVASDDATGAKLFTNRFGIFARGEGGFGGESGPRPANEAPSRAPDCEVESPTLPQQALIYRLSGDKNPLHADPEFAKLGGFDRPILHGLCSFGIACKAIVDGMLGGDTKRVARYQVRFAGVVFPGETIVTRGWREGDRIVLAASTKERGSPVLSNAAIWLRS